MAEENDDDDDEDGSERHVHLMGQLMGSIALIYPGICHKRVDILRVSAVASLVVRSLVRLHKVTLGFLIALWSQLSAAVRMHRQRRRFTT